MNATAVVLIAFGLFAAELASIAGYPQKLTNLNIQQFEQKINSLHAVTTVISSLILGGEGHRVAWHVRVHDWGVQFQFMLVSMT